MAEKLRKRRPHPEDCTPEQLEAAGRLFETIVRIKRALRERQASDKD